MKTLLISCLSFVPVVPDTGLLELRRFLYEAEKNEQVATVFYSKTRTISDKGLPLERGYKAMAAFMMCKYTNKPWLKINYFNEGKMDLEGAIASEPKNAELVFLRFSTQTNTPTFLGYNGRIEADKQQLLRFLQMAKKDGDADLINRITNFMLQSKYCSVEEKRNLQ